MIAGGHPVPLTVVSGFLGAGKTSLINHLLAHPGGRRLAVLVNDFGEINIDARLIAQRTDRVISLANGCICCDFGDNVYQTLFRMLEGERRPDGIVIETSGVADPAKLAVLGRVGRFFKLNATVTLVDAANVEAQSRDRYLADTIIRQIAAADLLVVNKADLADDTGLATLEAWLGGIAPRAGLVRAVGANVLTDVILGIDDRRIAPFADRAVAGEAYSHGHVSRHGNAFHRDVFKSWSFTAVRPFSTPALHAVLSSLPTSIIRGKGILWLDDEPARATVLQLVGGRSELSPGLAWAADQPSSQLVLITASDAPDFDLIDRALVTALAPSASCQNVRPTLNTSTA